MIRFRRHQKLVENEANLAHMIEAARTRELEHAKRALLVQNMKIKRRHKILAALPSVDYYTKQMKFSALRHPGTSSWFHTRSRFQEWLSSSDSDCLPFYGIPGSGKSVLAASIANDLLTSLDGQGSVLCYYYCDYAEAASLDPAYLIGSLIKQLLVHLPLDCFDEALSSPYSEEKPAPSFEVSAVFLRRLLRCFATIFMIIDDVGELTKDCQSIVLGLINDLVKDSTVTIKTVVTSRSEELLIKHELRQYECINISVEDVSFDIELFIKAKIDSMLVSQNPLLENETLKQEVIDALVSRAQGM
jgi:hypothetical protein